MPHMTGEEPAKELMSIRSDIPIFLWTGYTDKITEERARQLGVREMLYKPLCKGELAGAMRRILDGR